MSRSAQLGGNAPGTAHPGSPMAFATVQGHRQDEQTRQWFLVVQLDGGRTLRDVMVADQGAGAGTGARSRLPAKGVRGVIMYPGYPRTTAQAVWFGSVDAYFHGLDVPNPDASLSLHPSGAGEVLDERGARTTRYPGGDRLYIGPEDGPAHDFTVRPRDFKDRREPMSVDEVEEFASETPLELLLSGTRRFRRLRLRLFRSRGELTADTRTGRAALMAEIHDTDEAQSKSWVRGVFEAVGGRFARVLSMTSAGHEVGMRAEFTEKGGRARLIVKGEENHSQLDLNQNDAYLDAEVSYAGRPDGEFAPVASAPSTQENLQELARAVSKLQNDMDWVVTKLFLVPRIFPPLSPIAAVPQTMAHKISMLDVGSPSLQAHKGETS